ncbi:MAG: ABC transporter permease [Lachnospiraceae bacterium]|nr:ABC transporter permease [Lachnospiraceae bacterium]
MIKYSLQRIFYMILVFFIIMLMCFVLIRMLPLPVLPPDDPHTQVVEMRREAMGYNEPYLVQFGLFIRNIFTHFDWGVSDKLYFGQEVWEVFKEKLPATVIVNLYSILLSIPIGIFLGMLAALKKNTWVDYTISTLVMAVISVPSFVYAFLIQYFFCFRLQWFPFVMESGTDYFSPEMLRSLVPPVLALSFGVIAGFTRTTRAELAEVLDSDYMLLAKIKGLTVFQATIRHGLRNCFVVIVPQIFGEFLGILSGSLIIEKIFAIPGVGALTLNAINGPDYNVFMLSTAFYTAIGLAAGLVVDLSYGFLDPRIRMGAKE